MLRPTQGLLRGPAAYAWREAYAKLRDVRKGFALAVAMALVTGGLSHAAYTGKYTGNGTDNRNISTYYDPYIVFLKGDVTEYPQFRSASMTGDQTKAIGPATAFGSNRIQALTSVSAFQVGTDNSVNQSGKVYYWVAHVNPVAGSWGSYVGTGKDLKNIVAPESGALMVFGEGATKAVFRTSLRANTDTSCLDFDGSSVSDGVLRYGTEYGQVGTGSTVNTAGTTYHYWRWGRDSTAIGSYTGDGTDNRNVAQTLTYNYGLGFLQVFNMTDATPGSYKLSNMGYGGDRSYIYGAVTADYTDRIQELRSSGATLFQVGTALNAVGKAYHYVSQDEANTTAAQVRKALVGPAGDGAGRAIYWETEYEEGTLGFHVTRIRGTQRARVTRSLVPATVWKTQMHGRTTDGQHYAVTDTDGRAGDRYELEEVMLDGAIKAHAVAEAREPLPAVARAAGQSATLPLGSKTLRTGVWSPQGRADAPLIEQQGALEKHWKALEGGALRASVDVDGVYLIRQEDAAAAGFDVSKPATDLAMLRDGVPVPIEVIGGEDGTFDGGDAVLFYGSAVDTPWAFDRAYFLTSVPGGGARMKSVTAAAGPGASRYMTEHVFEPREQYVAAIRNGEESNVYGPSIMTDGTEIQLQLEESSLSDGALRIALQGINTVSDVPHEVLGSWDGASLPTLRFTGQGSLVSDPLPIPKALLTKGPHRLHLATSHAESLVVLRSANLAYERPAVFEAPEYVRLGAGEAIKTTGDDLDILDVTSEFAVARILAGADGGVATSSGGSGKLFISPERNIATGLRMVKLPEGMMGEARGASLVVVGPEVMRAAMQPLIDVRNGEGITAEFFDLSTIYDVFGFGVKSPYAIRHFLRYASSRFAIAPEYLLLAGDASGDPRGELPYFARDVVPTKLIDTRANETASDDWFADMDGDDHPDLAVGRFPAQTPDELAIMVGKTLRRPSAAARANDFAFMAQSHAVYKFETYAPEIAKHVPAGARFDVLETAEPGVVDTFLQGLSRGYSVVTLAGHGSVERFPTDGLLSTSMAKQLTNSVTPLFVAMTCLVNRFQDDQPESFGEGLMRARGGAAAVWGSSGLTMPMDHLPLLKRFYQALPNHPVGEAARIAKDGIADADVRRTWILLGDPSMRVDVEPALGDPELPSGCTCRLQPVRSSREGYAAFLLGLAAWTLRRGARRSLS